ncbi:branched-chain amino acid transport system II carrier protein, partial [Rhizobium sp. BR 315]
MFNGKSEVYQGSLLFTFIVSVFDGLKATGMQVDSLSNIFTRFLPLYDIGLCWLFPAIIGGICDYIFGLIREARLGMLKMQKAILI